MTYSSYMDIMERLIVGKYLNENCDPLVFWEKASELLTSGVLPQSFFDLVELG